MKRFTVCAILSVFCTHAKYIVEIDQTRPIYLPLQEYNFEFKNKSMKPVTVTLKNGDNEPKQRENPLVLKDQVINLAFRAAGLDLNRQTIIVVRYKDKENREFKQTYQFVSTNPATTKKILVKWDGHMITPQGGTMLGKTTSGLSLRGNIEAQGIKLMAKEKIGSSPLS